VTKSNLIRHFILWALGMATLWRVPVCRGPSRSQAGPHKQEPPSLDTHRQRVSIIIPARNEEHNLPNLLRSLRSQTTSADEIIVVDDQSTDHTALVAQRFGARVVNAGDLPTGWMGKTWACWVGAGQTNSALLIFLDADTTLSRDGIERLLNEWRQCRGLLTIWPYHITIQPYEWLSAFFNIVLMMGTTAFTPLGKRLRPTAAFGPCMVCGRDDYFLVGGHSAVKGALLDDISFGRAFQRAGLPVHCLGGRDTIDFRMYPDGPGQMLEGWTKQFGKAATQTNFVTLLLIFGWIAGCINAALLGIRALWPTPSLTTKIVRHRLAARWQSLRRLGGLD